LRRNLSAAGHHDLELLEADEAVAVLVDALDHAPALGDGDGFISLDEFATLNATEFLRISKVFL
jgi:ribosome assembly protein YihI (activator of Der GTPase)